MTLFDGIYPFYPQQRRIPFFDVDLMIVIIVFLTFACSFLLILPGIRGRARLFWFVRVITSLFIGAVIVAVNFTSDWEVGYVRTNTTYKAFSNAVVNAEVGLQVGLSGVNITLTGNPVNQINETIDYNEQFSWTFGTNYDEEYNEGLRKGLPNPILYLAEKFTQNSPCGLNIQYRISGHYASATMWVAFCAWLISNVLFSMPMFVYGAYMTLVTAAFMIFSLVSFSTVKNAPMCVIQFGTTTLNTDFGGSFWLTLATGLLCVLIGVIVIMMDIIMPEKLKAFFNLDEEEEEEILVEEYINPHFLKTDTFRSPLDFKLTIKNI
ncbi:dual oxidase maturation factor 1 [Microcaecilia unicolor]|uniref:Dual oxidase maturation factor 1-like n=1 Tax=Microcaecilia unicolor TaxID=1415580 RepID=A0A6P7WRF1_9AMPH|nr:dual oxidase maturation factor 1-like [Microcaecilia unicolor]